MNFMDALNTRAGDIEKPKVVPVGTYLWKVVKAHKERQISKGEWNVVDIPIVAYDVDGASNDVDLDDLENYGSLSQSGSQISFMFPTDTAKGADFEKTLYALRKFLLDVLRVDGNDDSTIKELLAKSIGCEFKAQAVHRHDASRDETFVDVKNYMALD